VNQEIREIYIVIKEGSYKYYLLKVQKYGFDVYCFPPHLGIHHSLHESGEMHFKSEKPTSKPRDEIPIALIMGEAGTPIDDGIKCTPLNGLGVACGICTAVYPINMLEKNFRKFTRSAKECFIIDKGLFSKDTKLVQIGVWAVPARNKISFEYNNPDIPENLLYKVTDCEPQIWIYAKPFV
jgi:hypothetical protein